MAVMNLRVFGKSYPLPLDLVPKSKMLVKAIDPWTSETQGTAFELNLDPSLKPAFEWIYQRLIDRTPRFEDPPPPDLNWIDIFQLADYLEMEDPILEMRAYALSGKIPQDELIKRYLRIERNSAIKNAVISLIVANNRFYADLLTWAQEYLDIYEESRFPDKGYFYTRLILIQIPKFYQPTFYQPTMISYHSSDYDRKRRSEHRPLVIKPYALHLLQPWQTLATKGAVILTCPEQHRPYIGNTPSGPWCFPERSKDNLNFNLNPDLFQGKVPYSTPAGFIVYLPSTFRGDYIFSNRFHSYPELNIVVPY